MDSSFRIWDRPNGASRSFVSCSLSLTDCCSSSVLHYASGWMTMVLERSPFLLLSFLGSACTLRLVGIWSSALRSNSSTCGVPSSSGISGSGFTCVLGSVSFATGGGSVDG